MPAWRGGLTSNRPNPVQEVLSRCGQGPGQREDSRQVAVSKKSHRGEKAPTSTACSTGYWMWLGLGPGWSLLRLQGAALARTLSYHDRILLTSAYPGQPRCAHLYRT
jgi:hypothetical protein